MESSIIKVNFCTDMHISSNLAESSMVQDIDFLYVSTNATPLPLTSLDTATSLLAANRFSSAMSNLESTDENIL